MSWEIRILSNGLFERKERVRACLWRGVDGESRGREGSEVKGESVSFFLLLVTDAFLDPMTSQSSPSLPLSIIRVAL